MGAIAGFVLLTLISYLLIVINIPFLIIPITIIAFIGIRKSLLTEIKKIKIKFNFQSILVLTIFAVGIAGQLAVISPSGIFQNGDLVFWSAHGHDGPWHLALMEEIKKGYPFQNPIFAGERLVNYHFFSDILPAIASKYLPVSPLNLYFRIFPFFYSLFLGASAYYLTKKLTNNFPASIWAVAFTYFAGSFGYLIGKGESVFWATQPQSSSGNPPQIISNFLVLAFLYFVLSYVKSKSKVILAVCILLLGTLVEFKVYAAIVLFGATLLSGLPQIALPALILTGILYLPNSSGGVSFLIFEPWWYIRTMIVEPSRLNLLDWELRRQTYIYEHNWKRVIFLEGLGFLIFFFGNLGVRFIGIWEFIKSKTIIKWVIILSIVLPLLFLQKGVASNTSQFLQYFILLFGILGGIAAAKITSKFKFLAPLIIVLMIPTQVNLLKDFYSRPPLAKVSNQELMALKFIKDNTDENSVILTPPYNPYLNTNEITPHIWDWFDTAYVSALSGRATYMDDYEQNDIMAYDYRSRLKIKENIFESEDANIVKQGLDQTNANLVYFPKLLAPKVSLESLGLTKSFENQETEVWTTN